MGFDFAKYSRITLIGSPGSGKSWLSKHVAEITGFPLTHLDMEYHLPGWNRPPRDEWIKKQQKFISEEKWIIDGNYDSTMELRFSAADLIIFLDINRFLCIWSMIKRQGKKRSDLPDYLEESSVFSKEFFKFCKGVWDFPKTGRKTIITMHEKYLEKEFLHIKSRREVGKILKR
ncbi:MAG: topology modulation protein [Oscillospiraceae bacterium]|nr:topology modulation protein [Oscillospiraceae bacterium]